MQGPQARAIGRPPRLKSSRTQELTKLKILTCFKGRINKTPKLSTTIFQDVHVLVVAMFGNSEPSYPSNAFNFPAEIHD